ncbi:hypothetical protein BDR03DRAFT_1019222 [Suillus americanus]|nr:hypothetical protein BDR03DRAFT_1019222 [Suillus americanus]
MLRTSKKKAVNKCVRHQSQVAIEVIEDSGPKEETLEIVDTEATEDSTEFEKIANPSGKEQDERDEDSDDGLEDRYSTALVTTHK